MSGNGPVRVVSGGNPGKPVRFQVHSRTQSEEVVPGCLEPVYTADAIYWLNHYLAMTGGEEPAKAHFISCGRVSAVGKLKGLEAKRELTVGNNKRTGCAVF